MKQPLIYIAGPYRAPTLNGIHENIQIARQFAVKVAQLGYYFICPHLNSAFMDGVRPDTFWLEMDFEILKRCDGLLAMPNCKKSAGATAEIEHALDANIPVFFTIQELTTYQW